MKYIIIYDQFIKFLGTFHPQVLYRYALALFKYKEEDILKIQDSVEIYQYLRFFTKTVTDGRWGTQVSQCLSVYQQGMGCCESGP